MTPDDFKAILLAGDPEELVDSLILQGTPPHFEPSKITAITQRLSHLFSIPVTSIDVRVVGSAKLGFALMEKRLADHTVLPRLRPFSPNSDIDLAVVSASLYEILWDEISTHANASAVRMPWDSGKLGDYMVHGWIRPDHFPRGVRLRRCDDWRDVFRQFSADRQLGIRRISGGLYHSLQHLRRYQLRGLAACRSALEIQP